MAVSDEASAVSSLTQVAAEAQLVQVMCTMYAELLVICERPNGYRSQARSAGGEKALNIKRMR